MLVLKTEEQKKIIKLLIKQNNDERIVIYNAIGRVVGRVLANKFISKEIQSQAELRVVIKNFIYELNEIAILDKTLLENYLNKWSKFFLPVTSNDDLDTIAFSDSFETVVNLNKYFNKKDIELINNNYSLFRDAMLDTNNILLKTSDNLNPKE